MATMTVNKMTKQVSPMEILENRKARKAAGMIGCLGRKNAVEFHLYGYRDVQCWNVDTNGRFPGDEGYDYTNPRCFCFDCRNSFDKEGKIDAELVNAGNVRACFVYGNLIGKEDLYDEEPENDVKGQCQDCEKKEAVCLFTHIDGRSFSLCKDCFVFADHDDNYLAHVELPRPRVRRVATTAPGLSNLSPAQPKDIQVNQRT